PPPSWPHAGAVEICDLVIRYGPRGPPAVAGVSLSIAGGEKVAVVGRTGAGKSSLLWSLLRMAPFAGGGVAIDGVDIASVPLWLLRRRLATVPQEPVFFRGTVRENLDPAGDADDVALWAALEACRIAAPLRAMTRAARCTAAAVAAAAAAKASILCHQSTMTGVPPLWTYWWTAATGAQAAAATSKAIMTAAAVTFSLGQRQLLCLARALVRDASVVCVDEAAAGLDPGTVPVVAAALRRGFRRRTVVMVAHRLSTVVELCGRVVVMADGRVVEDGVPR
ncbi:unnamed protein product, partial [Phaeothamnion confervicola]